MKPKRPLIVCVLVAFALLVAIAFQLGTVLVEKITHPAKYQELVEQYSEKYNIPEYIVNAVINVESGFKPDKSSSNSAGLMQIKHSTFTRLTSYEHLGENLSSEQLYDPNVNIRYGCYYLRQLFERYRDWNTVLAAYHAGEKNVEQWLLSSDYSNGNGRLSAIPSKDTARYVKKVNDNADYYKKIYYKKLSGEQK